MKVGASGEVDVDVENLENENSEDNGRKNPELSDLMAEMAVSPEKERKQSKEEIDRMTSWY